MTAQLPGNIVLTVKKTEESIIPAKSNIRYVNAYNAFIEWRKKRGCISFSEDELLEYFLELAENLKPTSLCSQHSMLKTTLLHRQHVDISSYSRLTMFLKKQAEGYEPERTRLFTSEEIQRFLQDAPDEVYLAIKVVCIFGITGVCRAGEFGNIRLQHIQEHGRTFLIRIPRTKTKIPRSCTIGPEFYDIVKKYMDLRPKTATTDHFFVGYHNGKCTIQNIGINTFAKMPKIIATYLKLPDAQKYTGHSFRSMAAVNQILADAGGDFVVSEEETLDAISDSTSPAVDLLPVRSHESSSPVTVRVEDEFDIVGKNVASKLRMLPPTQKIFAERLINEVLFEAQLGTLNRDCKLVTDPLGIVVTEDMDIKPFA